MTIETLVGHFRIAFCLLVLNHSYENEFNLHVNENLLAHVRDEHQDSFWKWGEL